MQQPWEIEWRDYYEILQLSPTADEDVIGWTCKKLRSKYHTDRDGGDEHKIRQINEAYAVLSNPEQRQHYDAVYRQKQAQSQTSFDDLQKEQVLRAQAELARQKESQRRQALEQELNQLRNAAAQPTQQGVPNQPPQQHPPYPPQHPNLRYNLSGDWMSSEGYLHRIWQTGNQLRVQAIDAYGRIFSDGSGWVDEQAIRWRYQTVPIPTPPYGLVSHQGEIVVTQAQGGRLLQGQVMNFTSRQTVAIAFSR